MNKLVVAIIAVGVLCSASSCNLWRRVRGRQKQARVTVGTSEVSKPDPKSEVPNPEVKAAKPVIDPAKIALFRGWQPRWDEQLAYSTFSGRAKINYENGGESQEFSANIRIEKDKRIWISITGLLGIEGARALITPDTIIAINRLQKEVRILPFADIHKLLPAKVDFATMQALIIGDVFPSGLPIREIADSFQTVVLTAGNQDLIHQAAFATPDALHKDTLMLSQSLNRSATGILSQYAFYEIIGGRNFSKSRQLLMNDGKAIHQISIEFGKVSFDEAVDMSFSIPAKYERK